MIETGQVYKIEGWKRLDRMVITEVVPHAADPKLDLIKHKRYNSTNPWEFWKWQTYRYVMEADYTAGNLGLLMEVQV